MLAGVAATSDHVLDGTGFTFDDLSALLDGLPSESDGPPPDLDAHPDVPDRGDAWSVTGDVWTLGASRLVCGDATDLSVLSTATGGVRADMVWTDPPYGVSYVGGTDQALTIENDDLTTDQLTDLLRSSLTNARSLSRPGAVWFVAAPGGPQFLAFAVVLSELKIWRQTLVWTKDRFVLGHSDYHGRHENLVFGEVPGHRTKHAYEQAHADVMYGWAPDAPHQAPPNRSQDTVWECPRPTSSQEHPTMKPVALIERAIRTHSQRGDLVLDPFGGSGSTLIAAFVSGRRAALVEKDPRYVDVICRRFQRISGIVPQREDGTEVDFLA